MSPDYTFANEESFVKDNPISESINLSSIDNVIKSNIKSNTDKRVFPIELNLTNLQSSESNFPSSKNIVTASQSNSEQTGSHFSGTVTYGDFADYSCPEPKLGQICTSTTSITETYSTNLHYNSLLGLYLPPQGATIGTCSGVRTATDIPTETVSNIIVSGGVRVIGDEVFVDMGGAGGCLELLGITDSAPYHNNNGILTSSGSSVREGPLVDTTLNSYFTEISQWTVRLDACDPGENGNGNSESELRESKVSTLQENNELCEDENEAPVANAGPDQTVDENLNSLTRTTVFLRGSGSDPDGDFLTYSWKPITPFAPSLTNPNGPNPSFRVPNISTDTTFEYELTVSDGKKTSSDRVSILVIAIKIDLQLDTEEITPKIGGTTFPINNVIKVKGFTLPNSAKLSQPQLSGGEAKINIKLEGITDVKSIPIALEFEPLIDTGGHDHLNVIDDQTKSAFGGFLSTTGVLVPEIFAFPDNQGTFTTIFRADNGLSRYSSASGFIDVEASVLILSEGPRVSDIERLSIRIAGLQSLQEGPNYNLVGSTSPLGINHPDNHYGNPVINFELEQIANAYAASHPKDLSKPRDILQYNDQSLAFGGVFDISGDWTPDGPRDGHKSHACGTDIDIDDKASNGKPINKVDLAELVMVNYPGAFMIDEGNHFHVHFEHCS